MSLYTGMILGDQSNQAFYIILDADRDSVDPIIGGLADYLLPIEDTSLSIYVDGGHWEDFVENEGA